MVKFVHGKIYFLLKIRDQYIFFLFIFVHIFSTGSDLLISYWKDKKKHTAQYTYSIFCVGWKLGRNSCINCWQIIKSLPGKL